MKILLANYRYFVVGGPDRYMFNVRDALRSQGHDVVPFALDYEQNEETPHARHFPPPLAGPGEVRFDEHSWTPRSLWRTVARSVYSKEVEHAVRGLVAEWRPDVAYVLQYLRKFSPSLLKGLKDAGIPTVVRLSAATAICPQSHFFRDGRPCTLCLGGGIGPSVRHRCVQESLAASLVHYFSHHYHCHKSFYDLPDRYVVPSRFLMDKFIEAGWSPERFTHLPTFVGDAFKAPGEEPVPSRTHLLYVGPFSREKGADILLRAYAVLRERLGTKAPPLALVGLAHDAEAKNLAASLGIDEAITLAPFAGQDELVRWYRRALCTVIPSRSFENMPNVLLESFASGTPVVGAGHGSLRQLIDHEQTGLCFAPGDERELADGLSRVCLDEDWRARAGVAAKSYAEQHFSVEDHLARLLALFEELVSKASS